MLDQRIVEAPAQVALVRGVEHPPPRDPIELAQLPLEGGDLGRGETVERRGVEGRELGDLEERPGALLDTGGGRRRDPFPEPGPELRPG